jgi:hypothetical protein
MKQSILTAATLLVALVLFANPLAAAEIILIDYNDGNSGNLVHDASINDGDFNAQSTTPAAVVPWVSLTSSEFATTNPSGVGSAMNYVAMGGTNTSTWRQIGIDASGTSGYTLAVGHTLRASFMIRPAANWDTTDTMGLRLFYTADNTLTGTATTLAEFVFTGRNNAAWSTEVFSPVLVTDPGAVGKKLFSSIQTANPGPAATATGNNEFARMDNLFVAVETTAASPNLTINPTFTFSNNGNTGSYVIPVANLAGDASTGLNISGVTPTGAAAGDVTVTTSLATPLGVAANAAGQIAFDFTPSAGSGIYNFNLEIASDDASAASPRVVAVAITVLPSPVLAVAPTFSFTNNGTSASYSIPISNNANNGTTALTITGVNKSGVDESDVSNLVFPASVAAGASGQITFDFTPSLGAGAYTFNLAINSDDDSAASPRVIAVAITVQDPFIAVASNTIDFGSLPNNPGSQTATLAITNNGGATNLTINSGTSTVTGNAAFSVTSWPGPIAPGASANIEVTFTPGANQGIFAGTLNIVSNDYNGTTPAIALKAFVFPGGNQVAAADFGTASSAIATNYTRFVVSQGASQTIGGVGIQLQSKNTDIVAGTGATSGALMTDYAATTFNGGAGNYISVILTSLNTGTLNLLSSHNYNNSLGLPINIQFGEQGGTLASVATNISRPGTAEYSTTVETGKTYELRVLENGTANLAYISGLLLWGNAVPGDNAYGAFVTNAGLDPATTGLPNLDPDNDGVATGIEWALGGNPNDPANPDTGLLPSPTTDGDSLTFTYLLADRAANDPNTTVFVEYGNNLIGWTKAENGVGGVTIAEDSVTVPGSTEITVDLPKTLDVGVRKLFARLRVSL